MGNTVSDDPFIPTHLNLEYKNCLQEHNCNETYFKEHCKQTCKDQIKPSARRVPTRRRIYNKIFFPFTRGGRQTRKKCQTRRISK
jgi:hypothetical protein